MLLLGIVALHNHAIVSFLLDDCKHVVAEVLELAKGKHSLHEFHSSETQSHHTPRLVPRVRLHDQGVAVHTDASSRAARET